MKKFFAAIVLASLAGAVPMTFAMDDRPAEGKTAKKVPEKSKDHKGGDTEKKSAPKKKAA